MPIRPVVLVYQDLATPTVTPTAPDLNCLIVGPAYHIQDYFKPGTTAYEDKADIRLASDYGALEGSPATPMPTGTAVITVAEPPNNEAGALLDSASVEVYFDEARVEITSAGTLTTVAGSNVITGAGTAWNTGVTKLAAGDRITIKDAGGQFFTRTILAVDTDTSVRLTADIPSSGFTPAGGQTYRALRQLNDQKIDSSFFTVTGNTVKVNGSVTLAVTGQGAKAVAYAKVYMAYRALRQDLVELDTVESTADITTKIGRLDARNPLATGVFVALQNTTSQVQFVGVLTNDLAGHTSVRDKISGRSDVYTITPLTADVSVLAMWNSDAVGVALPDEDEGRPQRFRAILGSGALPTTQTLVAPSTTGEAAVKATTAPAGIVKATLTGVASLITGGVIPGDILRVTVTSVAGTIALGDYPIANVVSATAVEVNATTPFASAGTVNITCAIVQADGVSARIGSAALTGVITAIGDDLFLTLKDPNGTFVSSGVAAGDLVQIPTTNPNGAIGSATVLTSFVVATVLSDQRLEIVNNGADTSTVANELPHGVRRSGSVLVSATTVNYKIVRTLSKSQQVTQLIAVAQSFRSKRMVLVWPDKVDVAGVTGGEAQPGYYAACAVGGMTAGLPSQQGFTNLGIAGVSQIYNSNTYFTDSQLTDLSNGGWYVFAQQTPTSLPYTVHQLTTDPSTLESGEFSVVKNFDFVSMFFVEILEDFLGQYNVTAETLTLLQSALNTGGDLLKLRTVAKIGAPLTSFSITELGVSPLSGDRVRAYIAIGLPKPLNVIELHLAA
jgi:hypothetical protein